MFAGGGVEIVQFWSSIETEWPTSVHHRQRPSPWTMTVATAVELEVVAGLIQFRIHMLEKIEIKLIAEIKPPPPPHKRNRPRAD